MDYQFVDGPFCHPMENPEQNPDYSETTFGDAMGSYRPLLGPGWGHVGLILEVQKSEGAAL